MPLTDLEIRKLKPAAKLYRRADGGGLVVEVAPSGAKRFRLKYRQNGSQRTLSLGDYPETTLADARYYRDPLPLNPASYVEDWHLLVDKVLLTTYDLADGSGRQMQVRMLACDSGGSDGVTANAYEFWRQLRRDGRNLHRRFQLVKGEPKPGAPLVRIDYPNAERKDRRASARGEVPVLMINSNAAKDMVNNMLGRLEPGGGMVFFPAWLPDWWYVELTAESRTAKGWVMQYRHVKTNRMPTGHGRPARAA